MRQLAILIMLVGLLVLMSRFVALPEEDAAATATPAVMDTLSEPTIVFSPDDIVQGDPVLISVGGLSGTSTVTRLTLDGRTLDLFPYRGNPSAIVAIDLGAKVGPHPVVATLDGGTVITAMLNIGKRTIVQAPLGIPEKLGGNTPAAAQKLAGNLTKENALLARITSTSSKLWNEPFIFPLADPIVTDTYGYSRLTSGTTISHKGLDFHAATGTPVFAMNDGVVASARFSDVYGNMIVIDHGFGLQTLYMHLSKLLVTTGDRVARGQEIGKSGDTGYAEGPHLHISVKIDGISIDPARFLEILGK